MDIVDSPALQIEVKILMRPKKWVPGPPNGNFVFHKFMSEPQLAQCWCSPVQAWVDRMDIILGGAPGLGIWA